MNLIHDMLKSKQADPNKTKQEERKKEEKK